MTEDLISPAPAAPPAVPGARAAAVTARDPLAAAHLATLLAAAPRGLAAAYLPQSRGFAQTVRAVPGGPGVGLRVEGRSVRYAAIAALGLSRLAEDRQRDVLDGASAAEVARAAAAEAADGPDSADVGAAALAAWAVAEVCGEADVALLRGLEQRLADGARIPTVAAAWALTAAVAAAPLHGTADLRERAQRLLREHAGPHGLYPHLLRAGARPSLRGHVGSFADQVYPVQALARASALSGEEDLLELAERGAARLRAAQGRAGQWWWHYDARTGEVVERYPVYSVHQHAMAPMVLHDLHECGGTDHGEGIAHGLRWLRRHPEVVEELHSDRFDLVWRKVGRREPRKAARGLGAAVTALRPGARLPGLDRVLPPTVVDHECRPYELGWLLYAWLPRAGER